MVDINWLIDDDKHYESASAYLGLLFAPWPTKMVVDMLRAAPVTEHRVNDVLRASGLKAASKDDPGVVKDREKINKNKGFEAILLVQGNPLIIADGFHRVSVLWHLDPFAVLKAKLVPMPLVYTPSPVKPPLQGQQTFPYNPWQWPTQPTYYPPPPNWWNPRA